MSEQQNNDNAVPRSVAFLGLGVMGFPMAGHLATAGHKVTVYNRSISKAEEWAKEYNGNVAATPAEAVTGAEIVFSCVSDDDALEAVCLGEDGAFDALSEGAIYIDHTTTSAAIARRLAEEATSRDVQFFDAPLSGGQMGAQKGILSVMIGGDAEAFKAVEPVLECYSKTISFMGEVGAGQAAKMVNQILIGGIMQSLSEALNLGNKLGLDMPHLIEVLSAGTGRSWQMDQRAVNMINGKFDYGFAVDLLHKDLQLCLSEAKNNGAPLPLTELVDSLLEDLSANGKGNLDHSSLITRL